ncbi:MAG: metallophosphatase family protein [Anaerolineales bacterium]|nr:metallophosphatase family protein [Anaerolineales bacterium]
MRVLVLSDIHANLTALNRVLEDAGSFDAVWCLGDLVGYGPDPNECIDRVQQLPKLTCLIGNHDLAALGSIPLHRFNADASASVAWTRGQLTDASSAYLASLKAKTLMPPFTLAHGSPRQEVWEYILDHHGADRNFDILETDYCLIGHSHLPLGFVRFPGESYCLPVQLPVGVPLGLTPRMILNPGSVGQPRDLDPRSAYSLLDTEALTWEPRRVAYAVADVQERILEAGLPERQAIRLVGGW